jgi:hypothetical protein
LRGLCIETMHDATHEGGGWRMVEVWGTFNLTRDEDESRLPGVVEKGHLTSMQGTLEGRRQGLQAGFQ